MLVTERMAIIEKLSYESRIAFVAFCAERCLKEARLHAAAGKQLESLPQLRDGVELLWARAERAQQPAAPTLDGLRSHLSSYDSAAPGGESVAYNYDVTLVDAANDLKIGLRCLQDPQSATPRMVALAADFPYHTVSLIYADYKKARKGEIQVIDAALLRLADLGDKPFSRAVFEGVPEWERGPLTKKYAEGRLKGTAEDEDDE